MLNKFKNWLGIEGVKIELLIPEESELSTGFIDGRIILGSKNTQTVTRIKLKLIERYIRGRENQKVDEFEIGALVLEAPILVKAEELTEIDFALPFKPLQSDMDEYGEKNILTKGISKLAKALHKVKSEYKVIAEAEVQGTALNPFAECIIKLT